MKLSESGSRGVMWRKKTRGSQELRLPDGRRERGDWWIRWACPLGHLHRELVGPKSMAQREVERRRVEQSCPRHTPKPTHYLLADVIREYLKVSKEHKRSWRDDQRYGEAWIARLGQRTLEDVTPAELEKIRIERLASRRRAEDEDDDAEQPVVPLAAATVNREMAFLRHVYNVAIRDEKTERNPVAKLKMLREPSGRVRYLTDEEEVRLMKALATDEDRDRVTVLLQTGFRRSEFLGLRWCDVDFKGRVLTVPKSKNGQARHVPMTSTVQAILSRRPRPLQRTALVFPNSEGHRDLRWAKKTVPAALSASRIDDFRFHDLRHTFASRLAMEGVDLLTLKELGGWKSLNMVQRYAHLSPGHRQQAIERLAQRQGQATPHRATSAE